MRNFYGISPIITDYGGRYIGIGIDPEKFYTPATINSRLTTNNITDTSDLSSVKTLTTSLTIIQTSLNNKFSSTNKPNIADVNNLQSTLDSKFSSTNKANINDVNNLQSTLDSKFSSSNRPNISDVNNLRPTLDSYFGFGNLPSINNVFGLSDLLGLSDNNEINLSEYYKKRDRPKVRHCDCK